MWDVPDLGSGRKHQVFVSLPASYAFDAQRRYPVLYVTDADYALPVIRSMVRRLNLDAPRIADFILVGLSYADGDSGSHSRGGLYADPERSEQRSARRRAWRQRGLSQIHP